MLPCLLWMESGHFECRYGALGALIATSHNNSVPMTPPYIVKQHEQMYTWYSARQPRCFRIYHSVHNIKTVSILMYTRINSTFADQVVPGTTWYQVCTI